MSERLIRALVSARVRAHEARGQTAAEYMGVLLLVSVIIAAVATTEIGHDITRELTNLVRDIAGGDTPKK
jgi:Flp pilus assembly pilin Flp